MNDLSLLPYLMGSGAPFSLEFSDEPGESGTGSPSRFPFEIISDTGALTRIIKARVATDAGSTVKPVFLMLSRDDYPLLEHAVDQVTNADIDLIWQRAFQAFRKAGSIAILKAQDLTDSCAAFLPLFSCSKTKQFFPPALPEVRPEARALPG
jgi:hypothetical protein